MIIQRSQYKKISEQSVPVVVVTNADLPDYLTCRPSLKGYLENSLDPLDPRPSTHDPRPST